ncbi:MAG: sigma-70 family RNA polymerase sigma factor [Chloroflexi bacterium]|nr:sigma-70 family RNA polymerase sigma factor [Chloroflexota bacterium]
MPENPTDAELVAQAKEEADTFGLLYERYVDKIYSYLYYRTGSHEDAEDLTARTFYRALNSLGRYQERGLPFSAWLYRIAHNLMANWHRDQSRHPQVSLEHLVQVGSGARPPEATAEQRETEEIVRASVRELPAERQQLLLLKFVEQMSNADIGEVMGRSEGAIKSLYHRTLLTLRQQLSQRGLGEKDEERGG